MYYYFLVQFDFFNETENHFKGQTIYGAITSLVDQNGNKVISTPASDLA